MEYYWDISNIGIFLNIDGIFCCIVQPAAQRHLAVGFETTCQVQLIGRNCNCCVVNISSTNHKNGIETRSIQ